MQEKLNESYEFLLKHLKDEHLRIMHAADAIKIDDPQQEKISTELAESGLHLSNLDLLVNWIRNRSIGS